jgi:antitoxin VapB
MLVLCARDQGLIANITRLVHFGKLPEELKKKHQACLQVECALWNASLPGVEIRKPFQAGVREYARQGYRDEWEKHHQGGPCSYEARDYFAGPTERRKIQKNQGIAWNPSITGTKSEDTILVTDMGVELLTPTPNWPMLKVEYCGKTYLRPNILERK